MRIISTWQYHPNPPILPKPLDQDGLLGLFDASETGADYKLQPALPEDMCATGALKRPSLEVVYDNV